MARQSAFEINWSLFHFNSILFTWTFRGLFIFTYFFNLIQTLIHTSISAGFVSCFLYYNWHFEISGWTSALCCLQCKCLYEKSSTHQCFTFTLAITATKFSFVCIYKSIPLMEDNFLSRVIYATSNTISILGAAAKLYLPGRPILNVVNTYIQQIYDYYSRKQNT